MQDPRVSFFKLAIWSISPLGNIVYICVKNGSMRGFWEGLIASGSPDGQSGNVLGSVARSRASSQESLTSARTAAPKEGGREDADSDKRAAFPAPPRTKAAAER